MAGYPVTVSWDPDMVPEGLSLTLTDKLDGSYLGPVDMSEASSVVLGEEEGALRGLRIIARSEGDLPPDVRHFTLMQNVPNPFNPVTSIRYDIPKRIRVKLRIFDVSGRVVRTLVDRIMPCGRHTVEWNGRNEEGRPVASGVYFYRLDSVEWNKTRKLVLLR